MRTGGKGGGEIASFRNRPWLKDRLEEFVCFSFFGLTGVPLVKNPASSQPRPQLKGGKRDSIPPASFGSRRKGHYWRISGHKIADSFSNYLLFVLPENLRGGHLANVLALDLSGPYRSKEKDRCWQHCKVMTTARKWAQHPCSMSMARRKKKGGSEGNYRGN